MKKKTKGILLCVLSLSFALSVGAFAAACDNGKDPGNEIVDPVTEYGTISGNVTAYGAALSGVKVSAGGRDTVTSATGAYTLTDVAIEDSVSVVYTKNGYQDKTLTVLKQDWTDKNVTLDAAMNLAEETGSVKGTVKVSLSGAETALAGASVTLGTETVITDADGTYTFTTVDITETKDYSVKVLHPACEDLTETVTVTAGKAETVKDFSLTATVVPVLNATYFALQDLSDRTSDTALSFVHTQNSAMWDTVGDVDRGHSEGLCLHTGESETAQADMISAIYARMTISSDNSRMIYRARGFLGQNGLYINGLLAVRVVNLTDYTVTDVKGENGEVWQTMDSNNYIAYDYDLSDFIGKDVVVIIGAKQGNHNAIDRICFLGENEEFALPYIKAADLAALTSNAVEDITDISNNQTAAQDAFSSWYKVGDQSAANEGWLLKDAGYDEVDSTDIKVYAYKKYMLTTNVRTIVIRARTFTGQNSIDGTDVLPQLIVKLIAEDGTSIDVSGNIATVGNGEGCEDFYFTFGEISGDYTLVIGMARGQRLAVESILFRGEMVTGNVTGTVQFNGEAVEGATIGYGSGNLAATATTAADGTFSLSVSLLPNSTATLTLKKDGYGDKSFTVSADDLTGGYSLGNITLSKAVIEGLSTDDLAKLTTLEKTTFGAHDIYNDWQKYGSAVTTINEGFCFQRTGGNTSVAYIYAKFAITESNRYMKFNAFKFDRGDGTPDQDGKLQVKVITADGEVVTLAANKVFCGGANVIETSYDADTKTLISNRAGGYTEGVYDFSDYINQTVTVVIQEITDNLTGQVVCHFNEIAFQSTNFYAAGTITGMVKDAGGNPIEGVTVNGGSGIVTTGSDGTFALDVAMGYTSDITLTFSKDGYLGTSITVTGAQLEAADGEYMAETVTLQVNTSQTVFKGVTEADLDALTAKRLGSNPVAFNKKGAEGFEGWEKSNTLTTGQNDDTCIPLGEFVYAKLTFDGDTQYMKLNCRGNNENIGGKTLVMVYADGQLTELAPWRVYGTTDVAIDGNYLINNRGSSYNEGIYDFSVYAGKTVVVFIYTAQCLDGYETAYTACNEIAFSNVKLFDKGGSATYYEIPEATLPEDKNNA